MFAQDVAYNEYVDTFFAGNSHPNISWINDIGKHRYGAAANALFGESRRAGDLEIKHVCLLRGAQWMTSYSNMGRSLADVEHWQVEPARPDAEPRRTNGKVCTRW